MELKTLAACVPLLLGACNADPHAAQNSARVEGMITEIKSVCDKAQSAGVLKEEITGNPAPERVLSGPADGKNCKLSQTPYGEWLVSAHDSDGTPGTVCSISSVQVMCNNTSSHEAELVRENFQWLNDKINSTPPAQR